MALKIWLFITLVVAAMAATAYAMTAIKWWRRKAWHLAAFNFSGALAISAYALGQAPFLATFYFLAPAARSVTIMLIVLATTKMLEYRRDERREQNAKEAIAHLHQEARELS